MRILIVVPSQDRISGNWVTALRFQRGLETDGHQVTLQETQLRPDSAFRQQLLDSAPEVAILLHAYRSGKPWLAVTDGLNIPSVVILTGTDINHGLDDPEQSTVIHAVLQKAAFALLQNQLLLVELTSNHPELATNLRELPPGITLGTAPYNLRKTHNLANEPTLFLCPAGLRPVKGVLELLQRFDQVATEERTFLLAFCGPVIDESYSRIFFAALEKRPWASYLGTIPPQAMANAMRGADVILNNSHSEGIANTLLEAATIGMPILARDIPGNTTVVKHNVNGLLYSNKKEFVQYAHQLLNRDRRQQLTNPEPDLYNPDQETAELVAILQEALDDFTIQL